MTMRNKRSPVQTGTFSKMQKIEGDTREENKSCGHCQCCRLSSGLPRTDLLSCFCAVITTTLALCLFIAPSVRGIVSDEIDALLLALLAHTSLLVNMATFSAGAALLMVLFAIFSRYNSR